MRKIIAKAGVNDKIFSVKNGGTLTYKNIELVCQKNGNQDNSYGIYVQTSDKEHPSIINFESGKITTSESACISTNGMDEDNSTINISGGDLLNSNSYAIYMPAKGIINISGGNTQGINIRRGTLNISDGTISHVSYSKEDADPIGKYYSNSLIWLGDTVAIVSGGNGYIKSDDEEIIINKTGGIVENSFGLDEEKPFTVYCVDTSEFNQIVRFEGVTREEIKIVDHDYISSDASKYRKAYTPKSQTKVFIDDVQVYPELPTIETSEDAVEEEGGI